MTKAYYGKNTEANPRYQAAVKAQRETERAKVAAQKLLDDRAASTVVALVKSIPSRDEVLRSERLLKIEDQLRRQIRPTQEEIIFATAERDGFSVEALLGKKKNHMLVASRHRAMVAVRQAYPNMPTAKIAALFQRDHATVISAFRNFGRARKWEQYAISPSDIRLVQSLHREGWRVTEIAHRVGITVKRVSSLLIAAETR